MKTVKEIAKELLLKGERINKGQFHAQYNTFTLTQRIEEIRKEGWVIKSKTIPGRRGMVEYWLEPEEIQRLKNTLPIKHLESKKKEDEQLVIPQENIAENVPSEPKTHYEQTSLLIGGRNY